LADKRPEAVCRQAAPLVAQAHADFTRRGMQLTGIGVGLPGAYDEATGMLRFAPNLGWREVNFSPVLMRALGQAGVPEVPLHVQNEADTAALSEYEFAKGGDQDSLIFVTCGVGVGAGIVLNDRLFTGTQGMAGEIGHSILQIDGPLCSCGRRGCAETFFGAQALHSLPDPDLGGRYLGMVLQNLWTTFNPRVLVVGGPSCERYPNMLAVARDTLRSYARSCGMASPSVRTARYGLMASAVGASALVLHHDLRPMHARLSALENLASEDHMRKASTSTSTSLD
jgi:predicted NBD/HSP70 family sugar kinase